MRNMNEPMTMNIDRVPIQTYRVRGQRCYPQQDTDAIRQLSLSLATTKKRILFFADLRRKAEHLIPTAWSLRRQSTVQPVAVSLPTRMSFFQEPITYHHCTEYDGIDATENKLNSVLKGNLRKKMIHHARTCIPFFEFHRLRKSIVTWRYFIEQAHFQKIKSIIEQTSLFGHEKIYRMLQKIREISLRAHHVHFFRYLVEPSLDDIHLRTPAK